MFISAQALDFLDLAENISFPHQKLHSFASQFPDENELEEFRVIGAGWGLRLRPGLLHSLQKNSILLK
jgi:hypothetical protein